MKKPFFIVMLLCLPLGGVLKAEPLRVVASTTLLDGIVTAIGGDRTIVTSVIPYAMCPGHFDLSPHTAKSIATADLFLQHGFEAFARGLTFADGGPQRVVLKLDGNAMIPAIHRELTTLITDTLCQARPADAAAFQTNAAAYRQRIDQAEAAVREARDKLTGVPVLAAVMNAPFVEWTGCKVVGTFPRDEGLSARALGTLLQKGRQEGVRLIVDNQQSLGRTGRKLADDLGVPLVVLSNFPPVGDGGYPAALQASLKELTQAIKPPAEPQGRRDRN